MQSSTDPGSAILDRIQSLRPEEIRVLDQVLLSNPQALMIITKAFPEIASIMPRQGGPASPGMPNPGQQPQGLAAGGTASTGFLDGATPGRADAVDAQVEEGSYVVPADIVSHLGGGNTAAGKARIREIMAGLPAEPGHAAGGLAAGRMVPVRLSDGEELIRPHHVAALGGPPALDQYVHATRQHAIKHLSELPGPR